jgi:hypothetical protein
MGLGRRARVGWLDSGGGATCGNVEGAARAFWAKNCIANSLLREPSLARNGVAAGHPRIQHDSACMALAAQCTRCDCTDPTSWPEDFHHRNVLVHVRLGWRRFETATDYFCQPPFSPFAGGYIFLQVPLLQGRSALSP